MRALAGRATDAELVAVAAWAAAAPENARQLRELRHMLADVTAWYQATPVHPPPDVEALIRGAEHRRPPPSP
ncbi:MAG TPA: hypothetical protein VH277_15055 [Gemmatimonadaceae bacterium]|nr:hypothetical protein [Gemmatimonadaceae bacterium]